MWSTRVSFRFLLALLAGTSLIMIAAGFYLNRRRRRYRAVSIAKSTNFDISSTPVIGSKLVFIKITILNFKCIFRFSKSV